MKSSLHATLLAGTAALAIALGAFAAHAGDQDDLLAAAQEHAAALDEATGGDNLVTKMLEAKDSNDEDSKEVIDALVGIIESISEE